MQLKPQHRAVPPRFSADHFKAAQSAPQSTQGSASSGLLSPVSRQLSNRSPPPRLEGDSYIGLRARAQRKKRHRIRHSLKDHVSSEDSHAPTPSSELIAQTSCSGCNICESRSNQEDSASISQHSSGKTSSKINSQDRNFAPQSLQTHASGRGVAGQIHL